MRIHLGSLLATASTTASWLITRTAAASAGTDFNAANSLSQILFWDDSWELMPNGGLMTRNGTLIVMANIYEIFLTWLYPSNDNMYYGVTLDGHGINPFRDTGGIPGTAEVNGAIWESLQVGIREQQGDHQLAFWVSNPGGVIFTAFNFTFNGTTALPSTYGHYATSIPLNAILVDDGGLYITYSPPEAWEHITDNFFCDQRTLSNSSTIGSSVQFSILGRENLNSLWIYGVMAESHSLANVSITGYKYDSIVYSETTTVRLGGFDDGKNAQGVVYQAPLFSKQDLPPAHLYRVNMTLIKGSLGVDFIISMTSLESYDYPLVPTPPPNTTNKRLLAIILPTVVVSAIITLLLIVCRHRFRSATTSTTQKPKYIGKTMKIEANGTTEINPYHHGSSTSSTSTVAISPLDEKRGLRIHHHQRSRPTLRSDHRASNHSSTPSFDASSSPRLSNEMRIQDSATAAAAQGSILGSSLLFSNTTSSSQTGGSTSPSISGVSYDDEEEEGQEEPVALSHEELARVFDRATELRSVQDREESERNAVLARREPERLETLARQLAGLE